MERWILPGQERKKKPTEVKDGKLQRIKPERKERCHLERQFVVKLEKQGEKRKREILGKKQEKKKK